MRVFLAPSDPNVWPFQVAISQELLVLSHVLKEATLISCLQEDFFRQLGVGWNGNPGWCWLVFFFRTTCCLRNLVTFWRVWKFSGFDIIINGVKTGCDITVGQSNLQRRHWGNAFGVEWLSKLCANSSH